MTHAAKRLFVAALAHGGLSLGWSRIHTSRPAHGLRPGYIKRFPTFPVACTAKCHVVLFSNSLRPAQCRARRYIKMKQQVKRP